MIGREVSDHLAKNKLARQNYGAKPFTYYMTQEEVGFLYNILNRKRERGRYIEKTERERNKQR